MVASLTLSRIEASSAQQRTNWLALFAMGIAVVVIANDFSAINVALPTMESDFHTDVDTIQWVVNAYALTFGVMIVTGGRLADMFGRRNAFFLGTAIFASMSLLGGAAQTEAWLIASRTLMGIGGALMWPAILGMTFAILPEEKAGLAGGIILGAAGLGNAMGPLIGGVLTDLLSWRWIFFLNVPISIFAVLVTYFLVHVKEPEGEERQIDYPGIAAISVGLVSLLIALDQVDEWGWGDPQIIGLLALAAILVAAFVPIERRAGRARADSQGGDAQRELPRLLLRDPLHVGDLLRRAALPAAVHGEASRLLAAGGRRRAAALPRRLRVVSFIAGPLYDRLGAKLLVVFGAACITLAPFLFSLVDAGSSYGSLVAGMVVLGRRHRQLLPDRDHRRGHLGRRIADQPRRRDHLHVPDRRRLDRARPDDDRLLRRRAALRRRHPGRLPARRGALAGRAA